MPFAALDLIRVQGKYLKLTGGPAGGTVSFDSSIVVVDSVNNEIIFPIPLVVPLDGNGEFSIDIPATNDPDLLPSGWVYVVRENINNSPIIREFNMEVPFATPVDPITNIRTLNMADVVPAQSVEIVSSYVLTTDSRMTNSRTPLDGSVTDAKIGSVSASSISALAQGKLTAGTVASQFGSLGTAHIRTVHTYGGIGDGVADDTAACQAALDAGYLRIPPGDVCRVTSTITALLDGTVVDGGGKILNNHATNLNPTLALGDGLDFRANMKVRNIHFAGNYQGSTHIRLFYANKWSISGCRMENSGGHGVTVDRGSFIGRLFDNDIEFNGGDGVSLGGAVNAISMWGNRIKSNAFGISLFGGGATDAQFGVLSNWGININGNDIEGNGKEGIVATGESRGVFIGGNYFEHNTFNAPSGAHIKLVTGSLGIEGVEVIGNLFNGAGVNTYPVWFAAGTKMDYRANSSQSHVTSNDPLVSGGAVVTIA